MTERVILVDENDSALGMLEKMRAHEEGKLHRAFSIFIFDEQGRMLLQRRSKTKYHSGGLWSNACCGHPRPGEETHAAARRRLFEEMGLKCELLEAFTFIYRAELDNQLVEHELDHVFIGECEADAVPAPDPTEVEDWKWLSMTDLLAEMLARPHDFTYWLKTALHRTEFDDLPALTRANSPSS
ncbi:MAG: isopentenyl-diphosphate Delta-isomerase [Blastocatellia bacterium]|jgi:isopentenyl-diphosphate delta-isomerase|nr:isopentenyl-diphosphate Delta-isomerase [Blastocatellia bacterium]